MFIKERGCVMNVNFAGGLTHLDSVYFDDDYSVHLIKPRVGSRYFPEDYRKFPLPDLNKKCFEKIPSGSRKILDTAVLYARSYEPCSMKLPNEALDALFKYFKEWYNLTEGAFGPNDCLRFAFLNYGYNKELLPYLDLSDYKFESGSYCLINLSNHNEVNLQDISNFRYCNLNGVNSNKYTVDKVDSGLIYGLSIEKSGYVFDKGSRFRASFCNMEGLNLEGITFQPLLNAVSTFVNLKNTGATIDSKAFEPAWYINCNFDGCFIKGIHDLDLEYLAILKETEFHNVIINYNGVIYTKNEEIQKLIDSLIGKAILNGVQNKEGQIEKQKKLTR